MNNIHAKISGSIPFHDIELERIILGIVLIDVQALNEAITIISPSDFYKEENKIIFEEIINHYEKYQKIDSILLTTSLISNKDKLKQIGGVKSIVNLTVDITYSNTQMIKNYCLRLREFALKRELIQQSYAQNQIVNDEYDVFEAMGKIQRNFENLQEKFIDSEFQSILKVSETALNEISSQRDSGINGLATGFTELDNVTGGWQKSDLIIIAARPAMGKTAFVLSLCKNVAVDFNKPVAIFSLEMSAVQMVKRMISNQCEVNASAIMKGNLTEVQIHKIHEKVNKLVTAPIYIDDTPGLKIIDLKSKARRLYQKKKIELIVVDYLQLISGGDIGIREQEISYISRQLKILAKELNIPVIALSQLSRSVEQRGGDKRPILSDLRESGSIEQDADIVSFLYRPEYYGFMESDDGESNVGKAELIIAKHRNGSLENIKMRYIGQYTKFTNLDDSYLKNSFNSYSPQDSQTNLKNEFHSDDESDDNPF